MVIKFSISLRKLNRRIRGGAQRKRRVPHNMRRRGLLYSAEEGKEMNCSIVWKWAICLLNDPLFSLPWPVQCFTNVTSLDHVTLVSSLVASIILCGYGYGIHSDSGDVTLSWYYALAVIPWYWSICLSPGS